MAYGKVYKRPSKTNQKGFGKRNGPREEIKNQRSFDMVLKGPLKCLIEGHQNGPGKAI